MATVKESVDIRASIEDVFALIINAELRSRLNPITTLLAISHTPEGQIKEGTTFDYRVIVEGKVVEYKNVCIGLEKNRYLETRTNTNPPFTVKLSVEASGDLVRLTQEEQFNLAQINIPIPQVKGLLGKLLKGFFGEQTQIEQNPESLTLREAEYSVLLKSRLKPWLEAIKSHLETENSRIFA